MWNRVNYFYFAKIFFTISIILTNNVSFAGPEQDRERDLLRYDMHIAFKLEAEETLKEWTIDHTDFLMNKGQADENRPRLYRPRFGVFAQSPHCAPQNDSGESVIPTFTANFFAEGQVEAQSIMDYVIETMKQTRELSDYFLRGRVEGQLAILKYDEISRTLSSPLTYDKFPAKVEGEQYFDAHIHLKGIKNEGQYREVAAIAASGAGYRFNMPIIANVLKEEPKPFITVRWYDTSRENAFKNLEYIYQTLYPLFLNIDVEMSKIPEFEVTLVDPQCQVTDRGWMPTPTSPFDLKEPHFEPSSRVFKKQ